MEKYTIDIDKVLDEFEETEALKIHSINKHEDSVIEHCSTANCSSNVKEKNPGNSWVEAALDINTTRVNTSNNLSEIESISDPSNTSSSQDNFGSSSNYTLNKDSTFYGTNKAVNYNKLDVHCDEDKNTKHLSYDIFYKPREPSSGLNLKNTNCLQSDMFSDEFGDDYSPDEILCVSVEENKPEMSAESQVTVVESISSYNTTQSKDFIGEGSQSNSEFLEHEDLSFTNKEALDNQTSNAMSDQHDSETLLSQSKASRPRQLSLKTGYLEETLKEKNELTSKDISLLQSASNFYSQDIESVQKDVSELVSHNKKQQSDTLALDNCNDHVASSNENLAVCNTLDAHNIREVQDANVNLFGVCAVEVPRNALDLQNGFSIQDDDSGVSSTEDISGNSPPQLNSESANSVVNENCDIEVNFLKVDNCNDDSLPDISSQIENLESSNALNTLTYNCDDMEQNDSPSYQEGTSTMKAIENVTMPYLDKDPVSKSNSQKFNSETAGTSISRNEESAFRGVSSVITSSNSISFETTNVKDTCNLNTQCDEALCKFDNYIDDSSVSQMATDTQLKTLDPNSNTLEENDDFLVKDIEPKVIVDVTIECSENLNLTLDSNDCLPPRLQRPTTLDLPTLLVASPDSTDETLAPSNPTDDHHIPADNLSASTADPNVAEMIPYVKQQPQIGIVKPYWIPDAEAFNCMHCGMKFTVLKRRHHCRGCGKVLCSKCCNQKAFLTYLNKEDRICQPCAEVLSSALQNDQMAAPFDSQSSSSCGSSPNFSPSPQMPASNYGDKNMWRPHPNNPDDYCSTIPPLEQIQSSEARPPPTVMVPIGVLKRGNKPRKEPKQVIFSDGIRPGGDLTDLTEPVESAVPVYRRMSRKRVDKLMSGESKLGTGSLSSISLHQKGRQKRIIVSDGEGPLPPVVLQIGGDTDEKMDWNQVLLKIQDDSQKAVNFALMKNMHLFVKITKLDCCFGNECWCFTSHGLCTVGQDEVMLIMERLPGERNIPRDIFKLYSHVYDSASKGVTFEDLGHIIFPEQILGSSDHRGFLFVRPTFQCLSKLTVPNTPYLVAILIHKWEVPWAKVFPLRLMLRMGAECRYYPCSLVSVRYRKPVYFEIGQTIMSVLADLRNFQFTIPVIAGLVVHMEEKKTSVNIPRNRYEKVMKILNNNNVEHVLALGSNFSTEADSHLVCMQKEEGDYQTQAINIENTTRKVTGASFIIFSGALKSTSGLSAKFSIVEDGLLIQISQETMVALHMALRDMRDLKIECGQINAEPEETVLLQWTRDDKKFNIGVQSPIDGRSFEGVHNLRIHSATDYAGENYLIRWTEVFFLDVDENSSSIQNELVNPCRLAETVAQSCCMALTPYLDQLAESKLIKLGLRVTLDSQSDRVEYDIGSRGKALPSLYMNALDSGLIPVILRLSSSTHSEKLSFELIFHILIK